LATSMLLSPLTAAVVDAFLYNERLLLSRYFLPKCGSRSYSFMLGVWKIKSFG
jgi:hypothetical protein